MAGYKKTERLANGTVQITLLNGQTMTYAEYAAYRKDNPVTNAPGDYYDENLGWVYEQDYA